MYESRGVAEIRIAVKIVADNAAVVDRRPARPRCGSAHDAAGAQQPPAGRQPPQGRGEGRRGGGGGAGPR